MQVRAEDGVEVNDIMPVKNEPIIVGRVMMLMFW